MFQRNKTRTVLSLLGIIIGVASVIVIGTLGESAKTNVKKSFGSSNLSLIQVDAGFMRRSRENRIYLDEAFREKIFDSISGINKIWYKNNLSSVLANGPLSVSYQLSAVEYGYIEMCGLTTGSGETFNVSDDVEGSQTIVLGSDAALALFPDEDPVGRVLIAQAGSDLFGFRVIGVLSGDSLGFDSPKTSVYIPRGFYLKKIAPSPNASSAVVEARSPKNVVRISAELKKYALEKTGEEYALSVNSMQSMLERYDEVTGTMNMLLSGVAAISLLVGGIGIMNIMIVTVTERKREIGVRKAIGAAPYVIRLQFLTESAAITILGGITGAAAGIGVSAVAVAVLKWSFSVSWASCAAAFLFSAFVGVFFGYYPASKAAKLDPVTALSSE
jgi:putative ABC transport system permease protein